MKPDFTNWISSTAKNMRIRHKMVNEWRNYDSQFITPDDAMADREEFGEFSGKKAEDLYNSCENVKDFNIVVRAYKNAYKKKIITAQDLFIGVGTMAWRISNAHSPDPYTKKPGMKVRGDATLYRRIRDVFLRIAYKNGDNSIINVYDVNKLKEFKAIEMIDRELGEIFKQGAVDWIADGVTDDDIHYNEEEEETDGEKPAEKPADESVGSAIDGMSVKELIKELQAKLREEYTTDCEIVIAPANGVPQKIVSVDSIVDPEEDDIAIVINTEDSPESATRFRDFDESEDGNDDED